MSLFIYEKCHRNRDDCMSVDCVASEPEGITEEQMINLDYEPLSFVCCGISSEDSRELKRDAFRLCFKNSAVDDISDNDEQDLTSLLSVISKTLAYKAVIKANDGIVEIPTEEK